MSDDQNHATKCDHDWQPYVATEEDFMRWPNRRCSKCGAKTGDHRARWGAYEIRSKFPNE